MSESRLVTAVIWKLKSMGIFAWRNNTGAFRPGPGRFLRYGFPGSPDILGVCPWRGVGVWLGVECKRSARQTPAQREFQDQVERHGGLYLLVREVSEVQSKLYRALEGIRDEPPPTQKRSASAPQPQESKRSADDWTRGDAGGCKHAGHSSILSQEPVGSVHC